MTYWLPRTKTPLLLGLSAAALAACSSGPKGGLPHPGMVQPIANHDEYGDVLSALGAGREAAARKTLEGMLKRSPADLRAKALLDSITVDPVAALGAQHFDYTVRPGETMQSLAERFLGSRDKFYLLARYNKIAVPDGLAPGRVIQVPGEAPRPTPVAPAPTPRPTRPSAPAPKPVATPRPKPVPAKPAANPAQAARLRAAGLAALNAGNVSRAVVMLGQAAQLDPGNAAIARDFDRAKRIRATVKARQ